MTPGPAIAQQLGPMGVNIGKVILDVNASTQQFKGINVPVHLDINPKTKSFTIKVLSPPTSELLKKELNLEKASAERKKLNVGNLSIEQVISVAKTKHPSMLAKSFLSAVKSVIGTCMSIGVLIENKQPEEISEEINQGAYKQEVETQKTETDPAKRKELDLFFKKFQESQQEVIKKEEAEKAAAEEKKAAETAGTGAAEKTEAEKAAAETEKKPEEEEEKPEKKK